MKSFLKWLGMAVSGLVTLLLLGLAVLYIASELAVNKTYTVPLTTIAVPTDSASIVEGKRLATLRGCFGGCHGECSEGKVLGKGPDGTRLTAPNLTRVVREYSNAELERAIRHGLRPNGRSLLGMPSKMFYHLSDRDLGAIIAFIRSQQPDPNHPPRTRLGPLARLLLLRGSLPFTAELIDHGAPRVEGSRQVPAAHGEYLANTLCSECHGVDLIG